MYCGPTLATLDSSSTQDTDQSAYTIERLLTALWHAEYQFRFNYYRTGMIMLADIGLEFGMTKRSQHIIESILPQVRNRRFASCPC